MRKFILAAALSLGVSGTAVAQSSIGVYITYLYPGYFCTKVYTSDGKVWALKPGANNEMGMLAAAQIAILTHQLVNIGGNSVSFPIPIGTTVPCYGSNPTTGALEVQQFPDLAGAGIVPYALTE